jgi:hypothetical protein
MNKTILFSVFILSFAVLGISGCKKDKEKGLAGTYRHSQLINSISYEIELQLTSDGLLIWTPVDTIPGHTASEVSYEELSGGQFRIFNDNDCGTEAVYSFTLNGDTLTNTAVTDDCPPREAAMSGQWVRQ